MALDKDGRCFLQPYRDAYYRILATPENKRGSRNGYRKVVADMNAAACDFALWIEVVTYQAADTHEKGTDLFSEIRRPVTGLARPIA